MGLQYYSLSRFYLDCNIPSTSWRPCYLELSTSAIIYNNRMLEYEALLSSDTAASRVFGQPDFTHNDVNHGGLSANTDISQWV